MLCVGSLPPFHHVLCVCVPLADAVSLLVLLLGAAAVRSDLACLDTNTYYATVSDDMEGEVLRNELRNLLGPPSYKYVQYGKHNWDEIALMVRVQRRVARDVPLHLPVAHSPPCHLCSTKRPTPMKTLIRRTCTWCTRQRLTPSPAQPTKAA